MVEPVAALFDALLNMSTFIVRPFAAPFDRVRIKRYFEERKVSVTKIEWAPFESGFLSSPYDRFYRVHCEESNGELSTSVCRTSRRAGVVVESDEG